MAPWAHKRHARAARLRQRGRQADRRRPQRPPGVHDHAAPAWRRRARTRGRRTSCSASSTRRTTGATTTCPARPGSARARLQRHVAELPRRRRPPGRHRRRAHTEQPNTNPASPTPGRRQGRRPLRRHGPDHARRRAPTTIPTRPPTAPRCRRPASRCACATGRARRQRAAAPGARRGRLHHPGTDTTSGGAIISTRDAVTFGFGLEQVDAGDAQRARQAHA